MFVLILLWNCASGLVLQIVSSNSKSIKSKSQLVSVCYLQGVVSDSINNPLNGVLVQAGSFSTMTNESGAYSMTMNPGIYNVSFGKLGYQTIIVPGFLAIDGNTATLNTQMWEEPYPPACVHAEVNP